MPLRIVLVLSFLLIFISDSANRIDSFIGVSNGTTILISVFNVVTVACLIVLFNRYRASTSIPPKAYFIFRALVIWGLFSFLHGAINANDYWDWKVLLLGYAFSMAIPISIIVGIDRRLFLWLTNFILKRLFIIALAIVPFSLATDTELYPRMVSPVALLILLVPYLRVRWRILIFLIAFLSISIDLGYRVNALRILFSMSLLILYSCRRLTPKFLLNGICVSMFCLPVILLSLGASGNFNVFRDSLAKSDSIDVSVDSVGGGNVDESHLNSDTRTFLYSEVFSSMTKKGSSFLIGEGGGSGYETDYFDAQAGSDKGRRAAEVGFLNVLLYSGFVGVFLYMLILMMSAFYGINRSNNYLCKLVGLWVAYRWIIFFVEDITKMDMNFFCIWVAIGLCLSRQVRNMSDEDLRRYFKEGVAAFRLPRRNYIGAN